MPSLDDRVPSLLQHIYIKPLAIQSNTARRDADIVAVAASLGLITTQIRPNEFGRDWRITNKGLLLLNEEDLYGRRVHHSV